MILKRLKLTNYRQHHALDVTIDGNIILVVGSNGRGKSNLIGAIQFALTGEQAGFKKDELMSWGATEGEVELWFQHAGQDGHIVRSLSSSRALFEYGTDVYNGITSVNDSLRVRVGVDRDMARQAVFVKQGEIDEVLFTDPRARELSFQRLMGIGDSAKIHKNLGEVLSTLSVPQNFDEQITEGHRRRHEQRGRLDEFKVNLGKWQAIMGPTGAELKTLESSLSTQLTQLKRAYDVLRTIEEKTAELPRIETELTGLPTIVGDITTIDSDIQAAERLEREASAWSAVVDRYKRAGEAIMALGQAPTTQEVIQALLDRWTAARAAVDAFRGQEQLYSSLYNSIGKVNAVTECPMCGSSITDIEQLKARLQGTITAIQASAQVPVGEARDLSQQHKQLTGTLDDYQRAYATRLAQFEEVDRQMKALPSVTADIPELRNRIQQLKQSRQAVLSAMNRTSTLVERRDGVTKDLVRLNGTLTDVGRTIDPNVDWRTPDRCKQCIQTVEQEIAKVNSLQTLEQQRVMAISSLNGSIQELEKSIKALDDTVSVLELKQSQQGAHKAALETLTKVRDWFHHSNGPRTLANAVLMEMNQDLNKFLSQFTAPFTVIPSDDVFGFKCLFTDGRKMPADGPPDASVLSGGQKVQLAVAFRFASYCMFANKLGLIALDEPTAYLDAANIGCFCNLMTQVKQIAQGMNLQIFMGTHEEALMPFADTVINLNVG